MMYLSDFKERMEEENGGDTVYYCVLDKNTPYKLKELDFT